MDDRVLPSLCPPGTELPTDIRINCFMVLVMGNYKVIKSPAHGIKQVGGLYGQLMTILTGKLEVQRSSSDGSVE